MIVMCAYCPEGKQTYTRPSEYFTDLGKTTSKPVILAYT